MANHPTLFTRIMLSDEGDALQTVDDTETFELTVEHFYFLMDIHHIIADYTTFTIMLTDVDRAYKGEALEPEGMTLAELSTAERASRQSASYEEGKEWYARNFDCGDCMNLLQVYNLFLSGTCQTLQSLGAIQVGRRDADGFRLVLRKAFRFISVAMAITCLFVWIDPEAIAALFGADHPDYIAETNAALRVFALSFVPFCYIYVLMIVYKLYGHHRMALFISFALSLTVIPVMWAVARWAPGWLWYSYLIAYLLEALIIFVLHRAQRIRFVLKD